MIAQLTTLTTLAARPGRAFRLGVGTVAAVVPGVFADPGVGHEGSVAAVPVARKPVSHPIVRTCTSWQ